MMETLQQAKHFIKTAYGISTVNYGADEYPPSQGVGQGNGAGPAIWVVISAILLQIMRDSGWGFTWTTALSMTAVFLVGFAFVDDTDLIHVAINAFTTAEDILDDAQRMLNTWEGLLEATGGALRPEKCFWYMIDFYYTQGKWKYKKQSQMPGILTVSNGVEIKRYDLSEAQETLGVFAAVDGNWEEQKKQLIKKSNIFANQLKQESILPEDVWYCFTRSYFPAQNHVLQATYITQEQWDEILAPVLSVALRKSKIASTFPRKLIFTSTQLQGLGIYHPYYNQHITQMEIVMSQPRFGSHLGGLINGMAMEVRREAGTFGFLGDIPKEILTNVVTPGWL